MTELSYHEIATLQINQAGKRLRQHLEQEPRRIDKLDPFERSLVLRTQGHSFLNRVENRADQLDRLDHEVERANRPQDQIKRVGFEMEEYVAVPPTHDDGQELPFHADPGDDK